MAKKEKPTKPEIQKWDITKVKPYSRNTKKHPSEQIQKIAASIHAFGFNQPIIVDENGIIIAGHGRLLAAKELNLTEVPVIIANWLSEEEVMAYRIADNKLNESEWDQDFLKFEMQTLNRLEFDLNLTGFESDELMDLLKEDQLSQDGIKNLSQELEINSFNNFDHTCPKCGFGFDDGNQNE